MVTSYVMQRVTRGALCVCVCVTFSMSRWSCCVTCQHGSPRTAAMLCGPPPVRQDALLLAKVSFIWGHIGGAQRGAHEGTGGHRDGHIRPDVTHSSAPRARLILITDSCESNPGLRARAQTSRVSPRARTHAPSQNCLIITADHKAASTSCFSRRALHMQTEDVRARVRASIERVAFGIKRNK